MLVVRERSVFYPGHNCYQMPWENCPLTSEHWAVHSAILWQVAQPGITWEGLGVWYAKVRSLWKAGPTDSIWCHKPKTGKPGIRTERCNFIYIFVYRQLFQIQKRIDEARLWWKPMVPVLRRQRQDCPWIVVYPGLHSEFQVSHDYI